MAKPKSLQEHRAFGTRIVEVSMSRMKTIEGLREHFVRWFKAQGAKS
jgi:hypothetical protein